MPVASAVFIWYCHDDGQLMNELVRRRPGSTGSKTKELINHVSTRAAVDPDITIQDPHDIAFSFGIRPAHIANLGVWSKLGRGTIIVDEDFGRGRGVGSNNVFQEWKSGVGARGDA